MLTAKQIEALLLKWDEMIEFYESNGDYAEAVGYRMAHSDLKSLLRGVTGA